MPATSTKQKTLACIALSIKQGKTPASYSKEAAKWAESASEQSLRDTCQKPIAK